MGVREEGGGAFNFPLSTTNAKRFCHCQTPVIVVVIIMLEVTVVAMVVFILIGLATLALNLALASLGLDLVPRTLSIYPPRLVLYGFHIKLDLDPSPITVLGLDHQQRLDHPQLPPLCGFDDDLVFLPGT